MSKMRIFSLFMLALLACFPFYNCALAQIAGERQVLQSGVSTFFMANINI